MEDVQPSSANTEILALKHQLPDEPPQAFEDPDEDCRCFVRVSGVTLEGQVGIWGITDDILATPPNFQFEGNQTNWWPAGQQTSAANFPTPFFFEIPSISSWQQTVDLFNQGSTFPGGENSDITLHLEVHCSQDYPGLNPNSGTYVGMTITPIDITWSDGSEFEDEFTYGQFRRVDISEGPFSCVDDSSNTPDLGN